MSQTVTAILFEELVKDQDDLGLFLDLHFGFDAFFRQLTAEFYELALWPGLKARVEAPGQSRPQNRLQPKPAPHPRLVDIKDNWLMAAPPPGLWPEGLAAALASENYYGALIYSQLVLTPPAQPAEAAKALYHERLLVLKDEARKRFPGRKIENNETAVWFYYDSGSPYRNWNTKEGLLLLAREVMAIKNEKAQPGGEGSLSGRYIDDLLTWAEIADQVFA